MLTVNIKVSDASEERILRSPQFLIGEALRPVTTVFCPGRDPARWHGDLALL